MGPRRRVIGAPNKPSSGIVVLSIRSMPTGALSQVLAKGLTPCTMAQGVWARNHTSSRVSLPPDAWSVWANPWIQTFLFAKKATKRYATRLKTMLLHRKCRDAPSRGAAWRPRRGGASLPALSTRRERVPVRAPGLPPRCGAGCSRPPLHGESEHVSRPDRRGHPAHTTSRPSCFPGRFEVTGNGCCAAHACSVARMGDAGSSLRSRVVTGRLTPGQGRNGAHRPGRISSARFQRARPRVVRRIWVLMLNHQLRTYNCLKVNSMTPSDA